MTRGVSSLFSFAACSWVFASIAALLLGWFFSPWDGVDRNFAWAILQWSFLSLPLVVAVCLVLCIFSLRRGNLDRATLLIMLPGTNLIIASIVFIAL